MYVGPDNYLRAGLQDLPPPRAVTHSYQHFNQQTEHSANYCSIMILAMLANVYVCLMLPIVLPSGGVFVLLQQRWYNQLVVSQSAHILSGVTRTILPRYYRGEVRGERGEDRTDQLLISVCWKIHLSLTRKICYSQFFVVTQLFFLLAANLDLFINPSLHTFGLQ